MDILLDLDLDGSLIVGDRSLPLTPAAQASLDGILDLPGALSGLLEDDELHFLRLRRTALSDGVRVNATVESGIVTAVELWKATGAA